jgi:hypothetical protein
MSAVLVVVLAACSSSKPSVTAAPTTTLATSAVLQAVSLQAKDASSPNTVTTIIDGDQVADQVSLDLCGGTFPSEALRVARHQVALRSGDQPGAMSTEALMYRSRAATAQAFAELLRARRECPTGLVPSPVEGEPAMKSVFHASPDATWPAVAGVDRLAFDVTLADAKGDTMRMVAVYLRRGRVVVALYFRPGALPRVDGLVGHPTPAAVAGTIAARLASLPASDVG